MKILGNFGHGIAGARGSAFKIAILAFVVLGVSLSLWNKPNWISVTEVTVLGAVLLVSAFNSTRQKLWLIWTLIALLGSAYFYDEWDRLGKGTYPVSWFEVSAALITAFAVIALVSTLLRMWWTPSSPTAGSPLK
jgi:hypothetical protein